MIVLIFARVGDSAFFHHQPQHELWEAREGELRALQDTLTAFQQRSLEWDSVLQEKERLKEEKENLEEQLKVLNSRADFLLNETEVHWVVSQMDDKTARSELHRLLLERSKVEEELSRSIWLLEQERDQLQIRLTEARRQLLQCPPPEPLPPIVDSPAVLQKFQELAELNRPFESRPPPKSPVQYRPTGPRRFPPSPPSPTQRPPTSPAASLAPAHTDPHFQDPSKSKFQ
ncbi:unnamed protein product [Cyprideis torosa]|uniref:Uncharacterized protein n=1 Tax=Cyprideis torosa TaxID=163714 RepID=A0A7R8W6G0_9CRUS|nr:unnamed protein product [Cyprideis torosa]CAG0886477.1 unnamed protein product [Cyprideis torosa]